MEHDPDLLGFHLRPSSRARPATAAPALPMKLWLPCLVTPGLPFEEPRPAARDRNRHIARRTQRAGVCSPGLNCACALPWEPPSGILASSRYAASLLPRWQIGGEHPYPRGAEKDVARPRRQRKALQTLLPRLSNPVPRGFP